MIDITRLDELYAAAIAQADHPAHSDYRDWIHKITDAWPAVAAELTRLREAHGELSSLRQRVAELGIELALHGDEVPHDFVANKLTEMLQVKQ